MKPYTYPCQPSHRDIMRITDSKSTSVVARHLKKLEQAGYIQQVPEVARGIVLKKDPTPGLPHPQ